MHQRKTGKSKLHNFNMILATNSSVLSRIVQPKSLFIKSDLL